MTDKQPKNELENLMGQLTESIKELADAYSNKIDVPEANTEKRLGCIENLIGEIVKEIPHEDKTFIIHPAGNHYSVPRYLLINKLHEKVKNVGGTDLAIAVINAYTREHDCYNNGAVHVPIHHVESQ